MHFLMSLIQKKNYKTYVTNVLLDIMELDKTFANDSDITYVFQGCE